MDDIISLISKQNNGDIKLYEPLSDTYINIPRELLALLRKSNGIMEICMTGSGSVEEIGWIIYPLDEIIKWSDFFAKEYSVSGFVFSDDGAGNPFYIKNDGKVYFLDIPYGEKPAAESLRDFFL